MGKELEGKSKVLQVSTDIPFLPRLVLRERGVLGTEIAFASYGVSVLGASRALCGAPY